MPREAETPRIVFILPLRNYPRSEPVGQPAPHCIFSIGANIHLGAPVDPKGHDLQDTLRISRFAVVANAYVACELWRP